MRRGSAWALLLAGVVACKGPTEPTGPGLHVLSSPALADTIEAIPAPIRIRLNDAEGRPVAGAAVHFDAEGAFVRLGDGAGAYGDESITTTDDEGYASQEIRLGARAGTGALRISVPDLGHETEVTVAVRHGVSVITRPPPFDTAIVLGDSYPVPAGPADRLLNPVAEDLVIEVDGDGITVDPATGYITGASYGRAHITVKYRNVVSSELDISVVPRGTLATMREENVIEQRRLVYFATDGSAYTEIERRSNELCTYEGMDWTPDGARLVVTLGLSYGGCHYPHLYEFDLDGEFRRLFDGDEEHPLESYPEFDATGSWLYFVRTQEQNWGEVWRASTLDWIPERVGPAATGPDHDYLVSTIPGTSEAVVNTDRFSAGIEPSTLARLNVATGEMDDLGIAGSYSTVSPDGTLIAYVVGDSYWVANVDGTGARELAHDVANGEYYPPAWSPDSEWIVVGLENPRPTSVSWHRLGLIEIATGTVMPLGWTADHRYPAWRPAVD